MKRVLWVFILLITVDGYVNMGAVVKTATSAALSAGVSQPTLVTLPTDRAVYKIVLAENGIYALTYEALQAAGMPVDSVDPRTFAMMHRGESVAYQFDGDTDGTFEPGESLYFYGWAFDSSRYEKQFVTDNVFWLWANDTPTYIETIPNTANPDNTWTTAVATVTTEPENDFFSTWTDQWDTFPNEPDAWYWDRIPHVGVGSRGTPITYTIHLPHPDTSSNETPTLSTAEAAVFTAEFTSRAKAQFPSQVRFDVALSINNNPSMQQTWYGRQNVNLTGTIHASTLHDGENVVTAVFTTTDVLYLNRITVSYPRLLIADNNRLTFSGNGSSTWQVSGFTETDAAEFVVWEIGDRKRPFSIPIFPQHLSGTADIAVTFGIDADRDATILLTTRSNFRQPAIQKTNAIDLDPPGLQAEWVAVTTPNMLQAAHRLADYRENVSGFTTHVVTIDDVIDQYSFGLPLPDAVRAYLIHAYDNWQTPPRYVLLIGDATINPRQLDCQWSCNGVGWTPDSPNMVPTDLLFVDRYQGLIPTDHTMALLHGDDLMPDVAIGRLSARTLNEAGLIVDKMIEYEQNQMNPAQWSQTVLFVADQDDAAGAFCAHNQLTGKYVRTIQQHLCLPAHPTDNELAELQAALFHTINVDGAWMVTYRGHGSIQYWGGGGDLLLSVADESSSLDAWLNDKPTVIVSADCLDGHFAWPGVSSISETLLRYPYGGTAAHWSSTGLGHDHEHSILINSFYGGLFQSFNREASYASTAGTAGTAYRIGDAILYAKAVYAQSGRHVSPLYSFTLQGDPALSLAWAGHKNVYLPVLQK